MFFDNRQKKNQPQALKESDIRARLYGQVQKPVIVSEQEKKQPEDLPQKELPAKNNSGRRKLEDEKTKIQREIQELKKELNQTKKKLEKMRGIKTRKLRLIIIYAAALVFIMIVISVISRNMVLGQKYRKPNPAISVSATSPAGQTGYIVQVATYISKADADSFASGLYKKGYRSYIEEDLSRNGKTMYLVLIGPIDNRDQASAITDRLKKEESIKDAFITVKK